MSLLKIMRISQKLKEITTKLVASPAMSHSTTIAMWAIEIKRRVPY